MMVKKEAGSRECHLQGPWDESKELDSAAPLGPALCEHVCESSTPRRVEAEIPKCF